MKSKIAKGDTPTNIKIINIIRIAAIPLNNACINLPNGLRPISINTTIKMKMFKMLILILCHRFMN